MDTIETGPGNNACFHRSRLCGPRHGINLPYEQAVDKKQLYGARVFEKSSLNLSISTM